MDLLYFAVSNQKYLPLLRKCIQSIQENSIYAPDILIIHTKDVLIPEDLKCTDLKWYDVDGINLTYALKLYIFKVPNIEQYTRLLYIDCDILCIDSLLPLFCDIRDNNLSVMKEEGYPIDHESFSIGYTDEELQTVTSKNSKPFNTGVMGFTKSVFPLFQQVVELINDRSDDHRRLTYYEQSFINHVFHLYGIVDDELYTAAVTIQPSLYYSYPGMILLHFAGWPGEVERKTQAMDEVNSEVKRYKWVKDNKRLVNQ